MSAFIFKKSSTDMICAFRGSIERYRGGQKELHCVFFGSIQAFDGLPRDTEEVRSDGEVREGGAGHA